MLRALHRSIAICVRFVRSVDAWLRMRVRAGFIQMPERSYGWSPKLIRKWRSRPNSQNYGVIVWIAWLSQQGFEGIKCGCFRAKASMRKQPNPWPVVALFPPADNRWTFYLTDLGRYRSLRFAPLTTAMSFLWWSQWEKTTSCWRQIR